MASCMKRNVETEGRVFQEMWTKQPFVLLKDNPMCLTCEGLVVVTRKRT